jgi:hypothetical protein
MEFRLLYEGQLLPSSNSKRRASEKHSIRQAFHPQLRRLWQVKPNLRDLADRGFLRSLEHYHHSTVERTPEERFDIGLRTLGKEWAKAGFDLVPLVLPEFALQCSLDILLLRPEEERFVFTQGDIDGQVKTLLDALRIPDSPEETGGAIPEDDEHPLFCLLQNDRLISEIKVTSDQLLMLPHEKAVKANDCFVVIHVRLTHRDARTFDNYFG